MTSRCPSRQHLGSLLLLDFYASATQKSGRGHRSRVCPGTAAGTRGHSPVPLLVPLTLWVPAGPCLAFDGADPQQSSPRATQQEPEGLGFGSGRAHVQPRREKGKNGAQRSPATAWKPRAEPSRCTGQGCPPAGAPSQAFRIHFVYMGRGIHFYWSERLQTWGGICWQR